MEHIEKGLLWLQFGMVSVNKIFPAETLFVDTDLWIQDFRSWLVKNRKWNKYKDMFGLLQFGSVSANKIFPAETLFAETVPKLAVQKQEMEHMERDVWFGSSLGVYL